MKLAFICSLVVVAVFGLMFLADKKHGITRDLVLLQRRRQQRQQLLQIGGRGRRGLPVSLSPRHLKPFPQLSIVDQRWPYNWRERERVDNSLLNEAVDNITSAANGTDINEMVRDDEYPFKTLDRFWAKGDVIIEAGHQNPSHLIQVEETLPDYRPKMTAVTNSTGVHEHGPPSFQGYSMDALNMTHARVAHTKLDHLGVNTGELPLWADALVATPPDGTYSNSYSITSSEQHEKSSPLGASALPFVHTRQQRSQPTEREEGLGAPVDFLDSGPRVALDDYTVTNHAVATPRGHGGGWLVPILPGWDPYSREKSESPLQSLFTTRRKH
eukprot:CAMPEP_0179465516 /NCGR_PEP_ID=MMETSP0799-20121207/47063_1 /TAXON_ID=46947 /ORGANISM="Geminigera cryophila, Strain CCMP2564" /LENGTH=327 /DNA_ID=CAMNT_0021269839 /DNA_START=40 /DNA_END=1023 /DNA_ORIENTATION=+